MVISKGTWLILGMLVVLAGRYLGLAVWERELLAEGNANNERSIRGDLISRWQKWLPGDEGVLASGILVGGTEGWSKKGQENFRRVGLSHIMAASGYNVAVVTGWVVAGLWPVIGRQKAIWFALVSCIMYMFLANWAIPVIRAGSMQMLVLIAGIIGRPNSGGRALLIGSLAMLIWEPLWMGEVSFQLSIAATAGLLWIQPRLPKLPLAAETSLAAQIATLPLIGHHFGQLSVIAPVVNAGVLWIVPWIMQAGAVASVVGWWWKEAGQIMAWVCWPGLVILTKTAEIAGSWEAASWTVAKWGWGWVVVYYLAIVLILKFKMRPKSVTV